MFGVTEKATAPIELTESETNNVAGGGNAWGYGGGQGNGAENPHSRGLALGNGKGQGAENGNGRFSII
jgi:hypothetical protein